MDAPAEVFQRLADPTRLRLLNLLARTGDICVCELVDALGLPQYNVSRHLHILLQAGLVEDHRFGKWVYYRLAERLEPFQRTLLRAVFELGETRRDFREDEARAGRRLKLRRNGLCCVGSVSKIGAPIERRKNRPARSA